MDAFDALIKDLLQDRTHVIIDGARNQPQNLTTYQDDVDIPDKCNNMVSNCEVEEADQQSTLDVYDDTYLQIELALPQGDSLEPRMAKVTKRMRQTMAS